MTVANRQHYICDVCQFVTHTYRAWKTHEKWFGHSGKLSMYICIGVELQSGSGAKKYH